MRKAHDKGHIKREGGYSFGTWILLYTVLFIAMGVVIWRPFYVSGRNMIWGNDGLYQTYATMVYFSKYWRGVIKSLLAGNLTLPMADPSIGMGLDVLTTLNHYGFGDVLEFISVLFPREKMETCYNFLACLRFYLAGLSFGVYCHQMGKELISSIGGAFVYVFCGFALYAGVRHPYFMNPMIYFPLMCLGAEQVLAGKKGFLLAIMAGVSSCNNLYFFYMQTILTLLYVLVRFFALFPPLAVGEGGKRPGFRDLPFKVFFSGCGWYLLGMALGAIMWIPFVTALLGSPRTESSILFSNTWFAYPLRFYKRMISGYIFPVYSADYWCVLVYSPAAFFGFLVLSKWRREREHAWLLAWFLILTLILWLPLGGLIMNGLIYVDHRWLFGYSFCMALVFMAGVEKAERITIKGLAIYGCMFCGAAFAFYRTGTDFGRIWGFAGVFFLGILAIVLWKRRKCTRKVFEILMLCCVVISSLCSARCLYDSEEGNYVGEFCGAGSAWPVMTERVSEVRAKNLIRTETFSRIAGDTKDQVNWGMVNQVNGTGNYFSLMGKEGYRYALDMENPDLVFPTWHNGLGDRAALMSLDSVRYFTKWADGDMAVPYGYVERPETDGNILLYESPYAMPVGYTYDEILPASEYGDLPALKKQQALMQTAVLEEEGETACMQAGMPIGQPEYQETEIPYTITSMDKVQWNQEQGELLVEEAGASMTIAFEKEKDAETYLRLEGLDIEGSWYEFMNVLVKAEGAKETKLFCSSSRCSWDSKLKNFLISLGGQEEDGPGSVTITFQASGEFKLEKVEFYSLPMSDFVKQAQERKRECLDSNFAQNKISGVVETSGKRVLCVSVPYSKGWRATVDGKKVSVWLCNGAHLGIFLDEGIHQVCFSYRTPGLTMGTVISFFAVVILCVLGGMTAINKKEKRKKWQR